MAHFGEVFDIVSGALTNNSRMCNNLGEIPAPTVQGTNAKQRRLSRPNSKEETRRKKHKRRKRKRLEGKMMSKRQKRTNLVDQVTKQIDKTRDYKMRQYKIDAEENREKAVYFWNKWKEEKKKNSISSIMHQIPPESLESAPNDHTKIGEGVFGKCKRRIYRGQTVAVKYFKSHARAIDVEHEAKMIMEFDHPGLPFVFGVNTITKPYFTVMEFYNVGGKCLTLSKAAESKIFKSLALWANILKDCCYALSHIHSKNYIHCDIKGDNIVIRNGCSDDSVEQYLAVLIDFGKMKNMSKAKIYKLSLREQERYGKYHMHIAPEVVSGKQPQSPASDVYSLGQVISLVCHYNRHEALRKIAVQCINGTPSKRPTLKRLIDELTSLSLLR